MSDLVQRRLWVKGSPSRPSVGGPAGAPVRGRGRPPHTVLSFEAPLDIEVQAEDAVFFAEGVDGPLLAEIPFHAHHLRVAAADYRDVGEGEGGRHLLLQGDARLRVVLHAGQGGVDAQAAHAEETL